VALAVLLNFIVQDHLQSALREASPHERLGRLTHIQRRREWRLCSIRLLI
jgi:hypothetical protein